MAAATDGRTAVFVDADNTLWDTDGVFASAQRDLFLGVIRQISADFTPPDPLGFTRAVDQAIAERHHEGLRYPPLLLVNGLEHALAGAAPDAAARAAVRGRHEYQLDRATADRLVRDYLQALTAQPSLRSGVRSGLSALAAAGCRLLIVTEGARSRVEATADNHRILHFFDRLIEGRKSPELYRRALALSRSTTRGFMIGDQLDKDIHPARQAGLATIYFPGAFRPRWAPSAPSSLADHQIASFEEVTDIVLGSRIARTEVSLNA